MADDNKKVFAIDVTINPFAEFQKKEPPAWFVARPKLRNIVKDIKVSRSMKLDARKWRKKTLEDGVYAVARYDLQLFSTALTSMQKDIDKAIEPKERKKFKFKSNTKDESKELGNALSAAETKVKTLWKKVEKNINDKVSLALDEVESDKGDNKKAIAAGKQAIKIFDRIETKDLFANPVNDVTLTMKKLALELGKGNADPDDLYNAALRELRDIESDYEFTAKSTGKVAKMFLTLAEKIANDKNADSELQAFGNHITKKSDVKSSLETMTKNIKDLGQDLDKLVNFVAKKDADAKTVASKAAKFKGDHEKKKGSATAATTAMRKMADQFKKIEKKLK